MLLSYQTSYSLIIWYSQVVFHSKRRLPNIAKLTKLTADETRLDALDNDNNNLEKPIMGGLFEINSDKFKYKYLKGES